VSLADVFQELEILLACRRPSGLQFTHHMGSMRTAAYWVVFEEKFFSFNFTRICVLVQCRMFQGHCVDFMDDLLETQQIAVTQSCLSRVCVPIACGCHKRGLPWAMQSPSRP